MSDVPKPKMDHSETYTYEDYLTWDGPERWELIDGLNADGFTWWQSSIGTPDMWSASDLIRH